ncbi:hypothetical protein PsorP6_008288 [Peronosclerospora sorghi]|uniref:Uncharacterized protein n=1 Tax=Peronosclerospora sorghi TaxID=230839 RepID=A0ACC0WAW1_9STRA|nr:hypothetical protein PsorP6_008288 [Peronosclerospora sorghi]
MNSSTIAVKLMDFDPNFFVGLLPPIIFILIYTMKSRYSLKTLCPYWSNAVYILAIFQELYVDPTLFISCLERVRSMMQWICLSRRFLALRSHYTQENRGLGDM